MIELLFVSFEELTLKLLDELAVHILFLNLHIFPGGVSDERVHLLLRQKKSIQLT